MKRLTIYNIINLILVLSFVLIVVIQSNTNFLKVQLSNLWFPLLCVVVGFSLIFKAIIFKSDSSTWFGLILFLNGVVLLVSLYYNITYYLLWPSLITIVAISSLVVAILFKDWLQYKIFIFLIVVNIPLYLYVFKFVGLGLFIFAMIIAVCVAVVVSGLIPKRFYLTKKEK